MEEDKRKRRNLLLSVGIMTMIVAILGATYAYFQTAAVNASGISGNVLDVDMDLDVTLLSTSATGDMIPQSDSTINSAVSGSTICVDSIGNTVCRLYSIELENTSGGAITVNGTITFADVANMSNLKWAISSSSNGGFSTYNTTSNTSLLSSLTLTSGGTATYYLVIWSSEIGVPQYDEGTFTGTITFSTPGASGITSLIF